MQVLSGAGAEADVLLSDGSNLLHQAAVDRQDVLVSAKHVSALLTALRQHLKPSELVTDLPGPSGGKQVPRDLRFLEHKTPDGLTVLYKVGWLVGWLVG